MKSLTLLLGALLAITPARATSPTPSASPSPKALSQNDPGRDLSQLQTLAAGGSVKAMLELAEMYRTGNGVKANWKTAGEWYEKAAAAGHSDAYLLLGALYVKGGPGLDADWARASDWYARLAASGDSDGYLYLGQLYAEGGPGLARDVAKSCAYFERAVGARTAWELGPDCPAPANPDSKAQP